MAVTAAKRDSVRAAPAYNPAFPARRGRQAQQRRQRCTALLHGRRALSRNFRSSAFFGSLRFFRSLLFYCVQRFLAGNSTGAGGNGGLTNPTQDCTSILCVVGFWFTITSINSFACSGIRFSAFTRPGHLARLTSLLMMAAFPPPGGVGPVISSLPLGARSSQAHCCCPGGVVEAATMDQVKSFAPETSRFIVPWQMSGKAACAEAL